MTSLRADGLCKVFGTRPEEALRRSRAGDPAGAGATVAVLDVGFTVEPGETFVVMGLSGSGKSTLIRMLNGLLTPTAGRVRADDRDVTALTGRELRGLRQRTMSMVFQHFALLPHRTVLDNAEYGPLVRGDPPARARERAVEALGMVGLTGWEDRFPAQLSGGMRQRVGLARALAAGTDVLLMDEAFSALDPLIKRDMQDQLVRLQGELGKTIVFITHDLNEAMRLGDRIAVMRAGRIVQVGTAAEILHRPADDYVARFVRDVDRSRVLTAGLVAEPAVHADRAGPLRRALELLREHDLDRLPITDRGRPVGLLERSAAELAPPDTALADLLHPGPEPVAADRTLDGFLGRVGTDTPVVDGTGRLVGLVRPVPLLRALGAGGQEDGDA
ncbi:glycine betaine/L-proline ABC transporter ATP-binding protein [Saccharopolyspora sp. 6V]|uniref:quaternary amine ABC transporter ATP-binding protein n=1 Tax=Saccharopolyspora sp. 6V TaxID=2877239 RepID=UPI001CD66FB2|nr:betaine/proline/choline family ABC transporter ATP-binding protein [Saccharopolyspora sp. 6V]MCA1193836.1 betaine/proline/choline family ABC transporter ATP-binding protein [Saccharopolyspora sp. 6V]